MPWTVFLESLDAWCGAADQRRSRTAFAAYLANRHDLTRTEAQEAIEDWAALATRHIPAVTPST